jgi:choline dehydrogenase-like flavoprotein
MLLDARALPEGASLGYDVAVVGSGPAGISVVERLAAAGLRTCLLESGGFDPERGPQDLNRGDVVGRPYYRLDGCRFRLFGGSSNCWGGWSLPLDPFDYLERDWVPLSGWPIRDADVRPYRARAAQLLQLASDDFTLEHWRDRMPAPLPLAGSDFENIVIQYSAPTNFAEAYGDRLLHGSHVDTILYATATELRLEPGTSRVGSAVVRTLTGRSFEIRARAFVLAAGAIENARLLLASRRDRPSGLGNEHDRVGRYFMEHVHVPAGHFVAADVAPSRAFYAKERYGDAVLRGFLAPTVDAQRRHRLPTCFIALEAGRHRIGTSFLGWRPSVTMTPVRMYRRLRRTRFADNAERLRVSLEEAYQLRNRRSTARRADDARRREGLPRGDAARIWSLYFRTEQAPSAVSRVMLGADTDALGMPRVRLDWRLSDDDLAMVPAWLGVLGATVRRRGLGIVVGPRDDWPDEIIGGPHHMGTTRMSSTARDGVVDRDCKVHSVDNLFVAGSSVFATGGYANPTFALVCLALRLGDHVAAVVGRRHAVPRLRRRLAAAD